MDTITAPNPITAGANVGAQPPRRFGGRALLLAAVLAVAALAGFLYWHATAQGVAPDSLLVSGNIEAHESLLSFKDVTSRIIELPFDEGKWVPQGTLIARLDDSNYQQQVAIDEAAVKVQEQQLASDTASLAAAEHTVANDQADLNQKAADYQRYQELWKNDATSAQSRDLAATAMKQSRAAIARDQSLVEVARQNIATAAANI